MTLAAEPDFIVADEPTTALDVTIQAQILDLLKQLQRERGVGLLLITHDLAVVSGMAHRVALMYAGQIVEVATARDFFSSPKHPYAALLLAALPETARKGQTLAAIAGTVPPLTQSFAGCRFEPRCPQAMRVCAGQAPQLAALPRVQPAAGLPAAASAATPADHSVRCWLHHPPADAASRLPARPVSGAASGSVSDAVSDAVSGLPPALHPSAAAGQLDPQPPAASLLDLRDVHVRFPQRSGLLRRVTGYLHAVKGVSLVVPKGRTLALVGESGCGKTTLGKAAVQLLRGVAEVEGQALMAGQDLFKLQGDALRAARRQVQIVFQDPFASLNPRLRVAEILDEGVAALDSGSAPADRERRVRALCERVGLRADSLQRYPHEFSGGQRQRIAIARALAVQPQLLVCDEPTSALDVSVQAQILNLLAELQRELGVSYLFITHNMGVVEYLADHVAVMRAGELQESGAADQVLGDPQSPYTRQLLAAVPRLTRF
jgi:peptide/nickel transport system ATP-binding protein